MLSGSFNAINASISQLAGGLASLVAGHIVQQGTDGKIHHYEVAGYVVVATSVLAGPHPPTIFGMLRVLNC